ncbi:MAG: holo-ACP synthase [Clostridia bacterium]|nr:holo-ACP synthase [Clostridia bacterium]
MRYYCGTDIIEVARVKKAVLSTPGFKEKVFTSLEIEYADKKSDVTRFEHYAGRFAAKEAIYKSLSKIDNSVSLNEIEILNDKDNKNRPIVNILKPELNIMQKEEKLLIDVSISHIKDYATANAIVTLL